MTDLRPRPVTGWLVPALLFVTACTGSDAIGPDSEIDVPVEFAVEVDFESGDGAQFLFLQPLSNGKPTEPLATGLELTVTICDESDECDKFEAVEQDDHYRVNWKSDKKSADEDFSVVVTGFGIVLGELTLTLEKKGKEKAGRTFPIKFWIGEGIGAVVAEVQDCEEANLCNSEPVPPGEDITITTEDEDGSGAPVAAITFEADDVPAGGLVVIVENFDFFALDFRADHIFDWIISDQPQHAGTFQCDIEKAVMVAHGLRRQSAFPIQASRCKRPCVICLYVHRRQFRQQ